MQNWLNKMPDVAALRGNEIVLKEALADLAVQSGFATYAYLQFQPGRIIAVSNYSADWQEIYFKENLASVDPVVNRAKSLKRAFTWSGELERPRLSSEDRAFYDRAADFEIRSGITIPIKAANGSISMFTLASDKTALNLARDIDAVEAAAAVGQLHARMSFLPLIPSAQHPSWLDPKEAAYLNWISVGKTMGEAGDLEGVKYNSVKTKLEEARKRLDVHTMPHLVALAIRAGLI